MFNVYKDPFEMFLVMNYRKTIENTMMFRLELFQSDDECWDIAWFERGMDDES